MSAGTRSAPLDRLLRPLHKWVWSDHDRRVRKLLIFGDVETDGGRDILRASEVTPDSLLRRLYLEHAIDELHHGVLFRERGEALLRQRALREGGFFSGNPLPGGHGLDDLVVEDQGDPRLLAFLHIAEKTAAGRFAIYKECVDDDPATRAIFEEVLRDEVFHMNYSYQQLGRLTPELQRRHVWRARRTRLRGIASCGSRPPSPVSSATPCSPASISFCAAVRVGRPPRGAGRDARLARDPVRPSGVADQPGPI